ncbi:putative alcohol acetyltransferase crmB [Paramyrothecium foliicola]|nr:putative alcohol acetyltransferase crmB [Paramyrothecium foliicola]
MVGIQQLKLLRPLGKLEQVSASCHHLGFFNNVGVSVQYKLASSSIPAASSLRRVIFAAAGDVIRMHRILAAIPVNEDTPETYFAALPSIDLNQSITFLKRSKPVADSGEGEDKELDAVLEEQHNTNFKAGYGTLPFWRLIILQSPLAEDEFTASFIYHHAIGDGMSGLVFHKAFHGALEAASDSSSLGPESEHVNIPDDSSSILPPLEELHPLPLNPTPSVAPASPAVVLKEWTGNSIHMPCKSRWKSLHLSPSVSKSFFQECKGQNLSVTSGLSSIIATQLFSLLPSNAEALTGIIPVSLRPWLRVEREVADAAIGTYFDATRVQFTRHDAGCTDANSAGIWSGARQVSKAIEDYLRNVSDSGEPYTAVAIFKTIPDVSAVFNSLVGNPRDAAFEVTNIGMFAPTSPSGEGTPSWQVGSVLLSRSSVASGAAVTVSVATGGDGSMTVGFSWQEGVIEDGIVDSVGRGVRSYFARYL